MSEPLAGADARVRDALLPCPCCAGQAVFHRNEQTSIDGEPDDNYGAEWAECAACGLCTRLWTPIKEPVKPLIAEAWNRRAQSPAVPQGRVIPREPTEAMLDAGYKFVPDFVGGDISLIDVYKAMHDAAPVVDPLLPEPVPERELDRVADLALEWVHCAESAVLADSAMHDFSGPYKSADRRDAKEAFMRALNALGTTGDERRDSTDPMDGAAKSHGAAATRRRER